MAKERRAAAIAALRKQEMTNKILKILEDKKGMTSFEIAKALNVTLPRTLLTSLQKEGLIVQRRGMTDDGKVTFFYVPNKNLKPRDK